MSFLRNLWQRIRSIKPRQWVLGFITLVILFIFFLGLSAAWDYTNSAPFCGTQCHTMPPHYESFLRSPHARVQCTECHIGRTFIGVAFTRKAVDAQFVWAYLTGNYEYPIRAKGLQPARESCEKCHWPEKFSWDKVISKSDFLPDAKNSEVATTLVMKTGGGTARAGLGRGIHWHIENVIEFKYSDRDQQDIPFIQVTDASGNKITYTDIESKLTADQLAKLPSRQMDCIDCHNRVSHTFASPEDAVDTALQNRVIDATVPEIKKKGVELITPLYKSPAEANQTIGNLEQFYKQNYATYYAQNTPKVQAAVKTLQNLYTQIHYPDQELDWTTHPDNLGHKDWPGCFRCHDGKHFTADRKQAIRLECNICHAIPEVATPGNPAPALSLARSDEPESHKTTTWLAEHRLQFNTSCQVCHDTNNAGGKDNSSFCSNSACHGTQWKFAGLNAPKLSEIIKAPVRPVTAPNAAPSKIPHPVGGNPDCQICHGQNARAFPFPADHVGRPNNICMGCHQPVLPPGASSTTSTPAGGPPPIPHSTAGREQCLGCHNSGAPSVPQITQFHKDFGFTNNNCLTCHKTGAPGAAAPTPQPTATPAPTVRPTVAPTSAPNSSSAASTASSSASASSASSSSSAASSAASSSAAAGVAKPLPASHAGRTTCTACHANGLGPKLPADHTGRTDAICLACHK